MAYFMVQIHKFALDVGMNPDKIRFRRHQPNELAHYCNDCWDLEALVDDRWLEIVGCADRGSYDLQAHDRDGLFKFKRNLQTPIERKTYRVKLDKKPIAQRHKENTGLILKHYANMSQPEILELEKDLEASDVVYVCIDDNLYPINTSNIHIDCKIEKQLTQEFYPHTIEPSFGIDRIIYAVLEHNWWIRDKTRPVLSLPKSLMPFDVAVLRLHNSKKDQKVKAQQILRILTQANIRCHMDNSNTTIGKRYVRIDEMGIRYALTVDPGTLTKDEITIRDRDTTEQIVVPVDQLVDKLRALLSQ